MSSLERDKQVVQLMFDGPNAHDRRAVVETLAEDFTYGPFNREEFVEIEFEYLPPLPDLTYAVDELFGEGDLAASRWRFTGTHTGAGGLGWLSNAQPTGKHVDIPGISIARIADGLIAEW